VALSKFYRRSWYDLAIKYYQLKMANQKKPVKLYKLSASGKTWPKTVTRKDWVSELGYRPTVSSANEQEEKKVKKVQMFDFIMQRFPQNIALRKLGRKKMLEMVDLTPEELRQVEDAEQNKEATEEAQVTQPEQGQQQIQQKLSALTQLQNA